MHERKEQRLCISAVAVDCACTTQLSLCSRIKCCSSACGCSACCLYSNPSWIPKEPGSIIQNATRTVTTIAIIMIVLFRAINLAISLPLGGSLEVHIQTKSRRPTMDNEVPFGLWIHLANRFYVCTVPLCAMVH